MGSVVVEVATREPAEGGQAVGRRKWVRGMVCGGEVGED